MPRVEEFLLYSAQCRFMADCSPNLEEKAEWDHLARHWLSEAVEIVETEGDAGEAPAPNGKVKVEVGEDGFSAAQSHRKT
jgi:hypothetical protein